MEVLNTGSKKPKSNSPSRSTAPSEVFSTDNTSDGYSDGSSKEKDVEPEVQEKEEEDESSNSTWELIRDIWPKDKRPPTLQNKARVNKMSLENVLSLFKLHTETEKQRKGVYWFSCS